MLLETVVASPKRPMKFARENMSFVGAGGSLNSESGFVDRVQEVERL